MGRDMHELQCQDLGRVLIVEDSAPLAKTLVSVLQPRANATTVAATVAEAREAIQREPPDVLFLDFALPDGNGFEVLETVAEASRMPALIAMSGTASPDEAFRLAQLGVRAFVPKPIELGALEAALQTALHSAPDLAPLIRASVGHLGVRDVEEDVRDTMVSEALNRAGSRKGAARLLSISRQLLQHILKRDS